MARALALGWGRPRAVHRRRWPSARRRWPTEVGGEALASDAEVAQRADVVVLCHKPPQLATVAAEVAPHAKAVVSILGGDAAGRRQGGLPRPPGLPRPAHHAGRGPPGRGHPRRRRRAGRRRSTRRSATLLAELGHARRARRRAGRRRHGPDVATRPAYYALVAEAQVDAGRAPRADRRPGLAAGGADDGGHRRAAAPPGLRHAGRAPRGHLAGRLDRPRARRAGARRRARRVLGRA